MTLQNLFDTMYYDAPVYLIDKATEIDEGIKSVRVWKNSPVYINELCNKPVVKIEAMTTNNGSAYLMVII